MRTIRTLTSLCAAATVLASIALNAHAFDKLELEHIVTRGKCEKCDFDKADLKNFDFRGVKLDDSHFIGADLRGAKIEDCGECNFTGASMADSDMDRASLDEVVFEKADLTGPHLGGVRALQPVEDLEGRDRLVGDYQADAFQKHSHTMRTAGIWGRSFKGEDGSPKTAYEKTEETGERGGAETRARNIALYYYIKIS